MEEVLVKVRDFADKAHGQQLRKYSSDRYIVHPVRVMEICKQYNPRLPVLAAALLHDVLEDTPIGVSEMRDFLHGLMPAADADETLKLVVEMTDVFTRRDFAHLNRKIRKCKELERIAMTSAQAQTIKYADIIDNSGEISVQDKDFAPRYLRECLAVLEIAHKGDATLRQIAFDIVRRNLSIV